MKSCKYFVVLFVFIHFLGFAQSGTIPYPIIFVHGLNSSDLTWQTMADSLGGDLKVFDFCLNHDGDSSTALLQNDTSSVAWRGIDGYIITNLTPSTNRIYAINFDNERFALPGHSSHTLSNEAAIYKQGCALGVMIKKVLEIENASKVILVGHSMGGLAIREYLQRTQDGTSSTLHRWWIDPNDPQNGHKVAHVVTIGTPHRGSNAWTFGGVGTGIDGYSEAVRDLRWSYSNFEEGVFLFGGNESAINSIGFHNIDVNCNGLEGDFIRGINTPIDGTQDNSIMPLPMTTTYTWITSDYSGGDGGDLVVDLSRQWLFYNDNGINKASPPGRADTMMTNKLHSAEASDYFSIIRGLDEPESFQLAYDLPLALTIKGSITYQSNMGTSDVDNYKVVSPSTGRLKVTIDNANSGVSGLAIYDKQQNLLNGSSIALFPFTLEAGVAQDTYYVQVTGIAGENTWQNPYSLFALHTTSPVDGEYTTDSNTVLLLHMNETSGSMAMDASGNNNNGIATGTTIEDGRFGKARNLQGTLNDYVILPSGITPTSDVTIEMWLKPIGTSEGVMFYWGPQSSGCGQTFGILSDLRIFLSSACVSPSMDIISQDSLKLGQWAHVAATIGASGYGTLYINGVRQNVPRNFQASSVGGGNDAIGYHWSGGVRYLPLNGVVDEFRISNIARNAEELNVLTIVSTNPARNRLNIEKSSSIEIIFSHGINSSTLNDNTIKVYGSLSGFHSGTFTYNSLTKTVTINPAIDFCVGELVTVTVTQGVRSLSGNSITTPYVWNFRIHPNSGTGVFTWSTSLPVYTPYSVVSADFDGDGFLDIAATAGGDSAVIFKKSGNDSFSLALKLPVPVSNNPAHMTTTDIDNDGDLDLIIPYSSSYAGPAFISVFENNGAGLFSLHSSINVGYGIMSVSAGDIDGDGDQDIVASINGSGGGSGSSVTILKNDGSGNFAQTSAIDVQGCEFPLAIADLDNDGDLDIAVSSHCQSGVSILKNDGNGNFTISSVVNAGNFPCFVATGDFDGDGDVDLAIPNRNDASSSNSTITILKNDGEGNFTISSSPGVSGHHPNSVTVADVDADGDLDLLVTMTNQSGGGAVSILINNGSGSFSESSTIAGSSNSVAVGDFDTDGDLDLAIATNYGEVSIFKNEDFIVPIQLASFVAEIQANNNVSLRWATVSEVNNYGFYVERRRDSTGLFTVVSDLIPGAGTTLEEQHYSWTDSNLTQGRYYYRLRQTDLNGDINYSYEITVNVVGVSGITALEAVPTTFELGHNYPNPFNPSTMIRYQLPNRNHVTLKVFDVLGREVATLVNEVQELGYKSVTFDASSLSSGIYFYRLQAGSFIETKKLLLLR